jgi:hypothetical protein
MKEITDKIKNGKILHYIVRTSPCKERKAVYVEAINALNPFVKPGYDFVSVSINEKSLKEFEKLLNEDKVEAYFYF